MKKTTDLITGLGERSRKWIWHVERFGFTPPKLIHRFRNQSAPLILCNSIPKAGTHLLERALCLHPQLYRKFVPTIHPGNIEKYGGEYQLLTHLRPGQIIVSHLPFSVELLKIITDLQISMLFIVRDPRDIAISYTFYVSGNKRHPLYGRYQSRQGFKDRLLLTLQGDPRIEVTPLSTILGRQYGWVDSDCLTIRYEDLIGASGGGDHERQIGVLRSIFEHLAFPVEDEWLKSVSEKLFSKVSPTFRIGRMGQWIEYFDEETTERFKATAGQTLIHYGYETDLGW